MKYKEWLAEWLENYVKPVTKERTYKKYSSQINNHINKALGDYELKKLSAQVLQKYTMSLLEKKLAPNTINGIISVIKFSIKQAVIVGIINVQSTNAIVRPKAREKQIECFSLVEQKQIEKYIFDSSKNKLFGIILSLYIGLRIGELLALTWEDIDLQKGILSVLKSCHDSWQGGRYVKVIDTPKTEKSYRLVPIPKQLIPKLKKLKEQSISKYVVEGKFEYGVEVRSYQRTFENLLKKLNLSHKGFHSLRHTFATRALECGMDVKTLSEILGHSNPTITLKRYAHSMLEHKIEMMNRVGKLLL